MQKDTQILLIFIAFKQRHYNNAEVAAYQHTRSKSYPKHILPPFDVMIATQTVFYT